MIAKIKGCRVVGIAGGREKCDWLTKQAGFDAAIDYKNENVGEALTRHCPKGIDVYFDNVGGEILDHALARLSNGARVVLCGAISQYNEGPGCATGPKNYFNLIMHGARAWKDSWFFNSPSAIPRRSQSCRNGTPRVRSKIRSTCARPRERAENDYPAIHRRELRQAIAQARRPPMMNFHA